MNNLQKAFAAAAPSIIMNLQRRNMEGYFYKDCKSMVEDILSKIEETEQTGFDWKTKTRLEFWNYAFVISGGDWGGARDIYDSGVR